jgi:hypothetical protein
VENTFATEFDAIKAIDLVNTSPLTEEKKKLYRSFINNFPEVKFYANTEYGLNEIELDIDIKFPENLRSYRKLLAGVLFGKSSKFKFKSFIQSTPRSDRISDMWYSLGLVGIPPVSRERSILLESDPNYSFIPISIVSGYPGSEAYFLSVNSKKNDEKIYEFNILDIYDTYSEGDAIIQSAYEVFNSYPQMLAHISEIKYLDGKKEIIVKARES